MKALVYRMGGLGDSLLIYPVLEILTRKGYEVTVWGNPEYFRVAEQIGFCKKATFYKPDEEFVMKIIFSQNREILSGNNSIYINPVPEEQIWIVDYYLKKLGFQNEEFSKTLPIALRNCFDDDLYVLQTIQNSKFKVQDSKEKDNNLCIIHPGSGSKKKNPDLIFFFELERFLKNRGFDVFFLLGPAEVEFVRKIKNSVYLENPLKIAKTLLKADLYIGLDSGVSHLSSYLGIPSIVIFGPTNPEVWHPIGENLQIIRFDGCKACFPHVCKERKCLEPEFLINKIKALQIYQKA